MKKFSIIKSFFFERKIELYSTINVDIKNVEHHVPVHILYNGDSTFTYDTIQRTVLLDIVDNLNDDVSSSQYITTHIIPNFFEPTLSYLEQNLPVYLV